MEVSIREALPYLFKFAGTRLSCSSSQNRPLARSLESAINPHQKEYTYQQNLIDNYFQRSQRAFLEERTSQAINIAASLRFLYERGWRSRYMRRGLEMRSLQNERNVPGIRKAVRLQDR